MAQGVGRLTKISNGNSVTKYLGFDALGRLTGSQQLTSDEAYNFAYSYNLAGALTSETYPSGRVVATGYDGAGRETSIAGLLNGAQTNYALGAIYAPHGAISAFAMGNTVTPWFSYNNRLQVTAAQAVVGGDASKYLFVDQPTWGNFGNNGNLQGETIWKGGPGPITSLQQTTRNYTHDKLNRLIAASDSSGWTRQFQYDAWGNMWVNPTGSSGVTIAPNAPTANVFNGNNQISTASYDNAGNLLSVNGFAIAYDAENRQMSAIEPASLGGAQELYLYDGEGQRVEKIAPAGNTIYVFDALGQLAAEYNTFASSFACTTCYVTPDPLGSVRMVTDQSGAVVTRHDYLPFGEENPATSASSELEQRFTGQIRDTETGLDFFNARYYTASMGRFNSADPANAGANLTDPQTWNGYSYVRNNPLMLTDLSGLDPDGPIPIGPTPPVTVTATPDPVVTGDPGAMGAIKGGGSLKVVNNFPGMAPAPIFVPFPSSATSATINFWDNLDSMNSVYSGSPSSPLDIGDSPYAQALVLLGQNVPAQNKFLMKFAGASVLAGTAVAGALQVASLPTMQVAVGPGQPFHVAFGANGSWLHATGDFFDMTITNEKAAAFARMSWRTFNLPVINPGAVLRTAGTSASFCVTGACYAFLKGWGL